MKKIVSLILITVILLSCAVTAYAEDTSREFFFELSVDGSEQKKVQPGDIITVSFTLNRTDSAENYQMYAMQNEIRYDSDFFKLVEGSAMLSNGISTTEIGLRDSFREFYMNFVSLSGGESWSSKRLVGSFQLEVIGKAGVTKITNQDYLVSTANGKDVYSASCQDVTIILTTDCSVAFETNGGSELSSITAQYGETLERPNNPVREGYRLVGWYKDLDLKKPWDFDSDTVQGNMTLYAKWEKGEASPAVGYTDTENDDNDGGSLALIIVLLLIAIGAIGFAAFILLNKKTVRFETNCKTKIPDQKVKKGGYAERPAQPSRNGRTFAGWFFDDEYTERWDFENDKVEDNMTLYAKWI